MFPYIGSDSPITMTRTDVEAPLLIQAAGWTYSLTEDPYEVGYQIMMVDPDGREIDPNWTVFGYTDAVLKVFGEIAARQRLKGAEDTLLAYVAKLYDTTGAAERKILRHARTATAQLTLIGDMTATVLEEYRAGLDENSQMGEI